MGAGVAVVQEDGRRLRRAHNRSAVLDAMVDLFAEGSYQPSTSDVARRAGISPRSLFRYFDDVDDLNRAAIDRHLTAARPLLEIGIGADAPTAARIDRLVAARISLYEAIAPAARAARGYALRHVEIAQQLTSNRAFLRHQVRLLFASELKGEHAWKLPGARRPVFVRVLRALAGRTGVVTIEDQRGATSRPHGAPRPDRGIQVRVLSDTTERTSAPCQV